MYDYTIIGGGPSGIFCADKLSFLGYNVCLIESHETLGGCHRVRYTQNKIRNSQDLVHTEHGPRIYLGSYLDFWKWIQEVDVHKEKHFSEYQFDMVSKDFLSFIFMFRIHEFIAIAFAYCIQCITPFRFSNTYTVDHFMDTMLFSKEGKDRLNRICRLIDGGNTNKTLMSALLNGFDVGMVYKIFEPNEPLDTLLWKRFQKKLQSQNVEILLKTNVLSINKGSVITDSIDIKTKKIICAIPPAAIQEIKHAPYFLGYQSDEFRRLSSFQQYEPYICATVEFLQQSPVKEWGIADEHPWGMIAIDMGNYFTNVKGSLFIVSITHPEKIDPKTNKSANNMNGNEFLNRIVELVRKRFQMNQFPIKKTLSPNVKKVNGRWIESDRAFLLSPPGWLQPDMSISNKHQIWTTGHHIGNTFHEYNSMESAIQNAATLLNQIEPKFSYQISKPNTFSKIIIKIIFFLCLLMIIRCR